MQAKRHKDKMTAENTLMMQCFMKQRNERNSMDYPSCNFLYF